jgi:hypothetical protein
MNDTNNLAHAKGSTNDPQTYAFHSTATSQNTPPPSWFLYFAVVWAVCFTIVFFFKWRKKGGSMRNALLVLLVGLVPLMLFAIYCVWIILRTLSST